MSGTRIGGIYACIAGDMRYGTTLEVKLVNNHIDVVLVSASPVGGMDGGGGIYHDTSVVGTCGDNAAELLKLLRSLFKTIDCGTIAKYGKPTKRFSWVTGADLDHPGAHELGFNSLLATAAINHAKASPL